MSVPISETITSAVRCLTTRSRNTYLSAQYRRLKTRRGHRRAIGAVRHSIIVAAWHMLTTGEIYHDHGGDCFTRLHPDTQTRRLVAQLERLGHTVTLQETPHPTPT
jgi:transposase